MAYSSLVLLIAAAFALGLLAISSNKRSQPKNGSKFPPGPPGKPLVGNLPDIPPKHSWLKFKKWSDQYGPLMRLNIAGREHYVASTEKVANDLLRERGGIYSSREQLPAAVQLLSKNLRPLFWPYNDTWRDGRKFMHQVSNSTVVGNYQATQILESARMLRDLIKDPNNYEHWFERYSAGIIFRLAFGKTLETGHEQSVRNVFNVVHTVERVASPGAYLVDTFPSLLILPQAIAPFKQELAGLHERELKLFRKLLNDVKSEMKAGTAPDCWEKDYLERKAEFPHLNEDEAAYVVGTLFEAGAGTTAAAMMSFMLTMVLHPEWFKKLQQEVDTVCGNDRLPTIDDATQLPIMRAVVKEVLRWRPVTAGGVPHYSIKDDVYNGHFIPAGTNIHANQWAIHREPGLYPDPDSFKPERWLESSYPTYREPLTTYPNLHNYSAFGFGRRICPGQNIAERSLYLLTARIAWACDVGKAEKDGVEVEPPLYDYTSGFNVQPNWFAFDLKARSQERVSVLEKEIEKNGKEDPLKGRM
ncbi:hypothetical protein PRZ48_010923 [Zasmidium cellare]|uniref:Cytochrome P450 n=1 Tax=Zasmidium cellare TaxID=395010 RepID=A0ABR0EAK7_ZASCE|nr:hypothetical protein PRZ48_010923 [Zasmidium cellare]